MITVYNAMLVTLGTLLAALAVLFFMPAYRRRIERFTTERIKRSLPLTENEIRADKDRLRASYAIELHKLESRLEEATVAASRQSVEINRRDAQISALEERLRSQKTNVEEHENARRVLEQTILDRLPKVEARLQEARRMLLQRDGEIATLTETGGRQREALEQATQMNVQLTQDVDRLKAALETRAARNRETIGDPRFDAEVALRSEIEALRAKSRDQAQIIEKLQAAASDTGASAVTQADMAALRAALQRAEDEVATLKARNATNAQWEDLEAENRAQLSEIAQLRTTLHTYESRARDEGAGDLLTFKAEAASLKAQTEDQRRTIEALRADLASANEKLARQAQHFSDELRRLSLLQAQDSADDDLRSSNAHQQRLTLAERIAQPRVPRSTEPGLEVMQAANEGVRETRPTHLKAIAGASMEGAGADVKSPVPEPGAARRPRLLDRISNLDKQG